MAPEWRFIFGKLKDKRNRFPMEGQKVCHRHAVEVYHAGRKSKSGNRRFRLRLLDPEHRERGDQQAQSAKDHNIAWVTAQ